MSGQGRIVAHREDCAALCQSFTSDPAGRMGAWAKWCKHETHGCYCTAAAELRELVEFVAENCDFDNSADNQELARLLAPFRGEK